MAHNIAGTGQPGPHDDSPLHCSICMHNDIGQAGDRWVAWPGCEHQFHARCVRGLLRQGIHADQPQATICPNCRGDTNDGGAFVRGILTDGTLAGHDTNQDTEQPSATLRAALAAGVAQRLTATLQWLRTAGATAPPQPDHTSEAQSALLWAALDPRADDIIRAALDDSHFASGAAEGARGILNAPGVLGQGARRLPAQTRRPPAQSSKRPREGLRPGRGRGGPAGITAALPDGIRHARL